MIGLAIGDNRPGQSGFRIPIERGPIGDRFTMHLNLHGDAPVAIGTQILNCQFRAATSGSQTD
jgi:hypothetical protein